jgi:tol-pal system protein YbgF
MRQSSFIALGVWVLLHSTQALALFGGGGGNDDLARRVERLEQRLSSANQGDLVMQVERLQQEIQQLRGELETQQHTLDALNRRMQDQYRDLSQRMGGAGGSGVVGSNTSAPAPGSGADLGLQPRPESIDASGQPQAAASGQSQEAAYKAAFNQLKSGQYKEAIGAFQAFITRFPGGAYIDNAQYWLGEAHYVQRDYDKALAEFDKVLKLYPQSPKVPDALLKMGYIQADKGNAKDSNALLKRLVQSYPESTAAGLAQKQLERLGTNR